MNRWLLPQGIEDVLPEQAEAIESLRRRLLDLFHRWGYALVMPPEVEFLDSLLTGVGGDLDLRTLKVVDQISGRLMGFRADMTPQVARVDAHRLGGEAPRRLCYAGTTLRAQPESYGRSRAPLQIGAEIFGISGAEADAEVIGLMAATLGEVGVWDDYTLDLGHIGLFRALVGELAMDRERHEELRDAVRRKDCAAIGPLLDKVGAHSHLRQALIALPNLHGSEAVLEEARRTCAVTEGATRALDELEALIQLLRQRDLEDRLIFDLGEVRGYDYHTGPVFTAYVEGQGEAVLYGGRYDGIGAAFGQNRAATGLSGDLKVLAELVPHTEGRAEGVLAPAEGAADLQRAIQDLRAQGFRVVQCLASEPAGSLTDQARKRGCTRVLVHDPEQGWQMERIEALE